MKTFRKTAIIAAFIILTSSLFPSLLIAGTTTYAYDELDRLSDMQYSNGNSITYSYDEIGNLTGGASRLRGW
jgi:hypothetical protein